MATNTSQIDDFIYLIYRKEKLWENYKTATKYFRKEQLEEFMERVRAVSTEKDFEEEANDIFCGIMFRREREMTFWEYYNYIMRYGKVKMTRSEYLRWQWKKDKRFKKISKSGKIEY